MESTRSKEESQRDESRAVAGYRENTETANNARLLRNEEMNTKPTGQQQTLL